uniref:Uncharacterized protein n=1 Tax=Solanum tuberosum TaxID=4113 RepID=M1BSM2_SOLTU
MKNDRPSTDAAVIEGMQGEITCEFAANYGNRNSRCVSKAVFIVSFLGENHFPLRLM